MKSNNEKKKITRINTVKEKAASVKHADSNKKTATNRRLMSSDSVEYRKEKLKAVDRRKARSRSVSMIFFTLIIMLLTVILIMNVMKSGAPKPQFMFKGKWLK